MRGWNDEIRHLQRGAVLDVEYGLEPDDVAIGFPAAHGHEVRLARVVVRSSIDGELAAGDLEPLEIDALPPFDQAGTSDTGVSASRR